MVLNFFHLIIFHFKTCDVPYHYNEGMDADHNLDVLTANSQMFEYEVGIDSHEYVKCFQFSRVIWLSRRGNNMYRVFLLLSRCRLPNLENLGRTCNRLYFCHPKNQLLNAL